MGNLSCQSANINIKVSAFGGGVYYVCLCSGHCWMKGLHKSSTCTHNHNTNKKRNAGATLGLEKNKGKTYHVPCGSARKL